MLEMPLSLMLVGAHMRECAHLNKWYSSIYLFIFKEYLQKVNTKNNNCKRESQNSVSHTREFVNKLLKLNCKP